MTSLNIAEPYFDPKLRLILAANTLPRKAVFLDRDGVINVDRNYVHNECGTEWVNGIFDLCGSAQQAGYLLVVVTNQSGIARGYYDDETFRQYTRWMHEQFESRGCPLTATYYCPHMPNASLNDFRNTCECRKPKPGMILAASNDLGIDLSNSILIGDKPTDILAARAARVGSSLLIESNKISKEHIFSFLSQQKPT